MKQYFSWFASLLTLFLLQALLIMTACSRAQIETVEEPTGVVNVTGAFFDWNPNSSSFAEGVFILLDPITNEVFRSSVIDKDKPYFKIENVPVKGKYYGILLDKRFEPAAYLQKTQQDGKQQRVFKFGTTSGRLGTIVMRDSTLQSSNHADLEFQPPSGTGELIEKAFEGEFSNTFVANPDIDNDGIPNPIDTNVDGDSTVNVFDAATYANKNVKILDSTIPAQYNYAYGIPKSGFFKCDYLRSPTTKENTLFVMRYACVFKVPSGIAESVSLTTTKVYMENGKNWDDGSTFDWQMKDDGTKGDLIASDGLWSANFSFMNSVESFAEQLIIATATMKDGTVKNYITSLVPDLSLAKKEDLPLASFPAEDSLLINFSLEKMSTTDGMQISATVINETDNSVVHTFTSKPDKSNEHTFKNINDFIPLTPQKYRILIKITAPPPLPGLLGCAFEIYSDVVDYPPKPNP